MWKASHGLSNTLQGIYARLEDLEKTEPCPSFWPAPFPSPEMALTYRGEESLVHITAAPTHVSKLHPTPLKQAPWTTLQAPRSPKSQRGEWARERGPHRI